MAATVNAAIAAAQEFIEARRAAEAADEAKKLAAEKLMAAFDAAQLDNVEVDGIRVTTVETTRRAVDVEKLKELLTLPKFKKVTKAVVDLKAFDAAIKAQVFTEDQVAEAVEKTTATQVRVYGDKVAGKKVA